MLNLDEHPGIVTFLLGMIVLVMSAVGLSSLMNQRFQFSSTRNEIQKMVEEDTMELNSLRSDYESKQARLAKSAASRAHASREYEKFQSEKNALAQQENTLREKVATLRASFDTTKKQFENYRASYRNWIWRRSVGERLGTVRVRGGREFHNAVIAKVTEVGIQIQHEHGIARLQAPELDRALQDRFQWDDEARRLQLERENQAASVEPVSLAGANSQQVMKPGGGTPRGAVVENDPPSLSKMAEQDRMQSVQQFRKSFIAAKANFIQITQELERAAMNAANSSSKSVPGKLETWKSREIRLRKDQVKARIELERVRECLGQVSPNDELLRSRQGDILGEFQID